jgi:hypothetical protein
MTDQRRGRRCSRSIADGFGGDAASSRSRRPAKLLAGYRPPTFASIGRLNFRGAHGHV